MGFLFYLSGSGQQPYYYKNHVLHTCADEKDRGTTAKNGCIYSNDDRTALVPNGLHGGTHTYTSKQRLNKHFPCTGLPAKKAYVYIPSTTYSHVHTGRSCTCTCPKCASGNVCHTCSLVVVSMREPLDPKCIHTAINMLLLGLNGVQKRKTEAAPHVTKLKSQTHIYRKQD